MSPKLQGSWVPLKRGSGKPVRYSCDTWKWHKHKHRFYPKREADKEEQGNQKAARPSLSPPIHVQAQVAMSLKKGSYFSC